MKVSRKRAVGVSVRITCCMLAPYTIRSIAVGKIETDLNEGFERDARYYVGKFSSARFVGE